MNASILKLPTEMAFNHLNVYLIDGPIVVNCFKIIYLLPVTKVCFS